jgi:hypothetical protein
VHVALLFWSVLSTIMIATSCAIASDCPSPSKEWAPHEQALWTDSICLGEAIDLTAAGEGRDQLSAQFLDDVLGDDRWRDVTERKGLRIQGAVFPERITLQRFTVARDLWLESCVFEQGLSISEVAIKGSLSLRLSRFGSAERPRDLLLANVRIGNNLYLSELQAGTVQLLACRIEGNLFAMRAVWDEAHTRRLYLQGTEIDSELVIESETIDTLYMKESVVRQGMKIATAGGQPPPHFRSIELNGVKVENAGITLDGVETDELLINLSTLSGSLNIAGGKLRAVALISSSIGGRLLFGRDRKNKPLEWINGGRIELRDAYVRVVSPDDLWPGSKVLEDFDVGRFISPLDRTSTSEGKSSKAVAIIDWLEPRRTTTELEQYYRFAEVLRKRGSVDQANLLMINGWERLRNDATGLEYLGLSLRHYLINYGYQPYRALIAVLGLTLFGTAALWFSEKNKNPPATSRRRRFGFWYSLDVLLPFVSFSDAHAKADLEPWIQRYFFVHQILGWILASFLIAALSGLTR